MSNSGVSDDEVRELIHQLSTAYENSLMHGQANVNLEKADMLLETASIRLSSRIVDEMSDGSCRFGEPGGTRPTTDHTCVLDDEANALRNLTDMLSYAAYRLENQARLASTAQGVNTQTSALTEARIRSMEHLYRMVFALSKTYLDQPQGDAYLKAAQQQLGLARQQMEAELSLRRFTSSGITARLSELSQLDDRLKGMLGGATQP